MSASNGVDDFADRLIDWQRLHGRHSLPWQNTRDPYRVWLSEIMLQQTQVATALPFYARFLQRFPDVKALADAHLDDVLALWSGLGYYRRARHLHRCAQQVAREYGGVFPDNAQALQTLPGIGRSTAAAIAAFCFGERVAILDGNVKRVLSRVLRFDGNLSQAAPERWLWGQASELLPHANIEAYTQGLMDLGATVCLSRQPLCRQCPVKGLCLSEQAGDPDRYPVKTRKTRRQSRTSVWLCLQWQGALWLVQRPPQGIWAGLWSLPELPSFTEFEKMTATWMGQSSTWPPVKHVLTHLDWTLHPVSWAFPEDLQPHQIAESIATLSEKTGGWFELQDALNIGLPAPLRALISTHLIPASKAQAADTGAAGWRSG